MSHTLEYMQQIAEKKFSKDKTDARQAFANELAKKIGYASPREAVEAMGWRQFGKLMKKHGAPSVF